MPGEAAGRPPHQQGHECRRQEDAQEIGERGRADRSRHIAPRNRGECDRRLHRGRQQRQEQQAHGIFAGHEWQQAEAQPEQREQREGHAKNGKVQPPIARPLPDRLARELGSVKEEQQDDAGIGQSAGNRHPDPARRQEAGDDDNRDQCQHEGFDIGKQLARHRGPARIGADLMPHWPYYRDARRLRRSGASPRAVSSPCELRDFSRSSSDGRCRPPRWC